MGYFTELPDVEYQNFLSNSLSTQSYLTVKNLFRRNKLRDDLENVFTLFNKYEIREGARPDTVAEEFYGNSELDWVVLITAGIINVRDDWPLNNRELYEYSLITYGNDLNNIHHYETKEIKDSSDRLIIPKGKVVDSDFSITYWDEELRTNKTPNNIVSGISNYEYEVLKNNKKRSIYMLRKQYLQQFLNDMRDIMVYQQSSEKVNDRLIRTENTRVITA
tara:strand:- start:229 stop:888 length:660 start_codon:yes stop_codon:yes gene_type:complete